MMSTRDFECKQFAFVFTGRGEKISFKNDNILITDENENVKHQSSCYRLFLLFVCGNFCITSGILERADKFGFNIVLLSENLRIIKIIPSRAEGNVLLRRRQYEYEKTEIASHIISNKIRNQNFLLKKRRNKTEAEKETVKKLDDFARQVLKPDLGVHEIMGIEGVSAKLYFQTLFREYNWTSRRPRVKHDIANCLLDAGYTILFNVINALLEMYGFDVYVGVLHTEFFHRKSLVCDLEEPFRPIIDGALIKAMNLGQIDEKDFWKNQGRYVLSWKKSARYVEIFLKAILEYRNEIFIYLQSYYRAFVQQKKIDDFPTFEMGGNSQEKKNAFGEL
jgi:CRISPR-associated protein Cas1